MLNSALPSTELRGSEIKRICAGEHHRYIRCYIVKVRSLSENYFTDLSAPDRLTYRVIKMNLFASLSYGQFLNEFVLSLSLPLRRYRVPSSDRWILIHVRF